MNLFRHFRFKISLVLPLGFVIENIFEQNCPLIDVHLLTTPNFNNLSISFDKTIFSDSENVQFLGYICWYGVFTKGIL